MKPIGYRLHHKIWHIYVSSFGKLLIKYLSISSSRHLLCALSKIHFDGNSYRWRERQRKNAIFNPDFHLRITTHHKSMNFHRLFIEMPKKRIRLNHYSKLLVIYMSNIVVFLLLLLYNLWFQSKLIRIGKTFHFNQFIALKYWK